MQSMRKEENFFQRLKIGKVSFSTKGESFIIFFRKNTKQFSIMVEPLLSGIVLGLVPVTIAGLFVTAYLQYRRGDQATW